MRNRKYIHRCSVCQFGSTLITVVSTAVQTTVSVIFMSRFNLCTAYCTYTTSWLFPHKIAYSFLVSVKLLTCSFRPFSTLLAVMPPTISNQGYKTWESLRSSPLFCHFYRALGPQMQSILLAISEFRTLINPRTKLFFPLVLNFSVQMIKDPYQPSSFSRLQILTRIANLVAYFHFRSSLISVPLTHIYQWIYSFISANLLRKLHNLYNESMRQNISWAPRSLSRCLLDVTAPNEGSWGTINLAAEAVGRIISLPNVTKEIITAKPMKNTLCWN